MNQENYRWSKICKSCGEFIPRDKEHICNRIPREKNGLYHCSRCHKYLPKDYFNKDKTKRYGILNSCKECRNSRMVKIRLVIKNMKIINNQKI